MNIININYKEKYKKALERASKLRVQNPFDTVSQMMEHVFPELAESGDERIRNWLIGYFHQYKEDGMEEYANGLKVESIIAWLEKQADKDKLIKELGEYKVKYTKKVLELNRMNKESEKLRKTTIAFLKDFADKGYENAVECIDWLEKQGKKEEPQVYETENGEVITYSETDGYKVVEPKFHEGDFIVNNYNGVVCQVTEIKDDEYCLWPLYDEVKGYLKIIDVDNEYHLWTIEDTKPGDVVVCKGNIKYSSGVKFEKICLFDNLDNAFFILTKTSDGAENYAINVNIDYPYNTVPATKEQRDTLFKVMHEVGYMWDTKNKELKDCL